MIEGTQVVKQLTGFGSDEAYGRKLCCGRLHNDHNETPRSSFQCRVCIFICPCSICFEEDLNLNVEFTGVKGLMSINQFRD